jgi:hypothetical protein
LGLFGKNPPSPEAKAIPERRPAEATPDQGGFASRLTETGVAGTNRGDSGVLSGAQGTLGRQLSDFARQQRELRKGGDVGATQDYGGLPDQVLDRMGPELGRVRERPPLGLMGRAQGRIHAMPGERPRPIARRSFLVSSRRSGAFSLPIAQPSPVPVTDPVLPETSSSRAPLLRTHRDPTLTSPLTAPGRGSAPVDRERDGSLCWIVRLQVRGG